jgi:hypothetical protein
MKDMLCINAEQCGDDVVIVHDGDVQITLMNGQSVTLLAIHCTGTLRLRAIPGPHDALINVHVEVQCGALVLENSVWLEVWSLTLHSPIPPDWRVEMERIQQAGDAAVFIHPPAPQQRIMVEDALVLSPWPVQLPPKPSDPCPAVPEERVNDAAPF